MQNHRCAYCERRTGTAANDGHVEHFRNQADHPALTTDWNNMFWSCTDIKFCGKHKDECRIVGGTGKCRAFNVQDILDPSADDPDHFLLFVDDGSIQQQSNLSVDEQRRFSETLRVFQLADAAFLVDSRKDAVKPYIDAVNDLRSDGPERLRAYIARQLVRISGVPFETAIRHFLESVRP
jgi:uncharacterized protein (TIGR02646 family)